MSSFATGLLLALGMILPIGVQNIFVLSQGLTFGTPRAFIAAAATASCDSVLIALGALGASAILAGAPWLRDALIVFGVLFLVAIAMQTLRASPERVPVGVSAQPTVVRFRPAVVVAKAAGVSLLNPHAVLDTVGVIGGAIAAQSPEDRWWFGLGSVSASWVWFFGLTLIASRFRIRFTPRLQRGIQKLTAILLLAFAVLLLREVVTS